MSIILLLLSVIVVIQILKIIVKMNIVDKSLMDYFLEFIVTLIAFGIMISFKVIPEEQLQLVAAILILYECVSCLYMYYKYFKEEKLNEFSIKNVIDSSEFGILIFKGNKCTLTNSKMHEILNKINIKENYIENIKKASKKQMDGNYIVPIEENYYLFCIRENEIIAFDVTEEYMLQKELDEQNKKIERNNNELIESIKNIEDLEREKNLLKIKNKYHDLLGQNLSILQQYLNNEEISEENFNEIKYMIKEMFINIEDKEDSNANLQNLIRIHKKMGTNIILQGKLPQNKKIAKVFFEIIREATTNAIKHAGSSQIVVKIDETLEKISMKITNDGKKPNEFITENEGIKGMRRKVEEIDGYFYVSTVPEFSVNVSVGALGDVPECT